MTRVGLVTLLVHEYDAAIAWFVEKLGFVVHQDTPLTESKRWVVVGPADSTGARILLAKAGTEGQQARVGDQTGGRVFLFLETDDFARDHARLRGRGVKFIEEPRREGYGTVAVFEDLYGNRWDLIEHRLPAVP
jgi:catechol 2,3-dioxygenase-like lactoylglutathione lyase family enzyme